VEGEIDASAYTAQDGTLRASLDLRARNVRFIGSRGDSDTSEAGGGYGSGERHAPARSGQRTAAGGGEFPGSEEDANLPKDDNDIPF